MIDSSGQFIVIAAGVGIVALIFLATMLQRRRPHGLNKAYFNERWEKIQYQCRDKATWPLAIIEADKLVDEALKRSKFKGKTMGERLVAAQHSLTNNDGIWYGHKLRNKIVHEQYDKLAKKDVFRVLTEMRQALRDLGAL